jgi:putative tricarboxylic transport membrane protein
MLKVSDLGSGLAIASLGAFVFVHSRSFPAAGGVPVGPSFYPGLIGSVLFGAGLILAASALRQNSALPLSERPQWLHSGKALLAVCGVAIAMVAYALLAPALGFLATSFLVTAALLIAFGVKWYVGVGTAFGISVILHVIFAVLMRVPLPFGIIEQVLL